MGRAYLIYIFLLLISLKGWAQNDVAVISSTKELQRLGKFVYFLEDEVGNLTFEDILLPENQAKFQQNQAEIFARPASASVFWFKMTIQNETEENLWLNFGDSFATWEADFYAPDTQGNYTHKIELGVLRPQENKFFPSTYYCVPLNLKKTTSQTFYLRLSGSFPKTHDFLVGSTKKMNEHLKFLNSVVMLFVGFILSILGYNLFIWFSTQEKVYLIYIFYLSLIIIIVPFDNGDTLFYWKPLWTHHFLYHNLLFILMGIYLIRVWDLFMAKRRKESPFLCPCMDFSHWFGVYFYL